MQPNTEVRRPQFGGIKKGTSLLAQFEQSRQTALAKRIAGPVLVDGIGPPKLVSIPIAEQGNLTVDPRIQRVKITTLINTLIHVLKGGGTIPDPITLAKRPDGTLSILDGQQRFWAYSECRMAIPAVVYEVPDFERERKLFLILNDQRRVTADHIVFVWSGPCGEFIRGLGSNKDSPLMDGINFGRHGTKPYSAAILAKALVAMAFPRAASPWSGKVYSVLTRLDSCAADSGFYLRATTLAKLYAQILPPSTRTLKMHLLPALAIARVAGRRFNGHIIYPPSSGVISRLRRIQWERVCPTMAMVHLPSAEAQVEKRWPEVTK